jgi:hypothetical protein
VKSCSPLLALLLAVGCRPAPLPVPEVLTSHVERGPLQLIVRVTPKEAQLGDPIRIELSMRTPSDHVVRFAPASVFEDVRVLEPGAAAEPTADPNGLVWRQTYVVSTLSSGTLTIPALAVEYGRRPADADQAPSFDYQLDSEPLAVEVRSALTTQDSTMQPRDITSPRALPPEPWSAAQIAGLSAGALAAAALAYWMYRRLRARLLRPPPPTPADVWALRELAQLAGSSWIATGRGKEFYYRVTEIVRRYVELQFGLAAPDMTTEEFLGTVAGDARLAAAGSLELTLFLEACDLVRYAALEPSEQDGSHALETARRFVASTARPARAAAPAAGPPHDGDAGLSTGPASGSRAPLRGAAQGVGGGLS